MARIKRDSFQIVPINHATLGVVYRLKEGDTIHGTFGNQTAAEKAKIAVMRLRDEMKIITETKNQEFEVEL